MWSEMLQEAELSSSLAKRLPAFDDKTMKGNASHVQKVLHVVSAYATDLGIYYGQVTTE